MPMAPAGEPAAQPQPSRRRHVLKRIPGILCAARPEGGISSQNFESAASHQYDEKRVAPMDNSDRQGLLAPSLKSTVHLVLCHRSIRSLLRIPLHLSIAFALPPFIT